jgi:hypothetical protein
MALKRVLFFPLLCIAAAWLHYDRDSANILSSKVRKLAYWACTPANPNAPLLTVCQYADKKLFGMQSLHSALHSAFDHATVPVMKREIKLMEEGMRFKAANAFKNNYNDMRVVAAITAAEKQEWVLQMSERLDHIVHDCQSTGLVGHLLVRSKHNSYWSNSATDTTITGESWVFANRVLIGRRHTWLLQFETAVEAVREKLQHPGEILKEIDTNKYFKTPQLSKTDELELSVKKMLIMVGAVRILKCFA